MKITNESTNTAFSAYKCRRPKMTRGCWDSWAFNVTLDGHPIRLMFESGYGSSFYFIWQNQWYRIPWNKPGFPVVDNCNPDSIESGCILKTKG